MVRLDEGQSSACCGEGDDDDPVEDVGCNQFLRTHFVRGIPEDVFVGGWSHYGCDHSLETLSFSLSPFSSLSLPFSLSLSPFWRDTWYVSDPYLPKRRLKITKDEENQRKTKATRVSRRVSK